MLKKVMKKKIIFIILVLGILYMYSKCSTTSTPSTNSSLNNKIITPSPSTRSKENENQIKNNPIEKNNSYNQEESFATNELESTKSNIKDTEFREKLNLDNENKENGAINPRPDGLTSYRRIDHNQENLPLTKNHKLANSGYLINLDNNPQFLDILNQTFQAKDKENIVFIEDSERSGVIQFIHKYFDTKTNKSVRTGTSGGLGAFSFIDKNTIIHRETINRNKYLKIKFVDKNYKQIQLTWFIGDKFIKKKVFTRNY